MSFLYSANDTYSVTADTAAADGKTYYEQYDIGNTEVEIYTK